MRFRGGGHKRKLRIVDFKRDKTGIPATVASIEYDPNRSARIALLAYADGEKRYILQPDGLKLGAKNCQRSRCRHPGRQRAAAEEYSSGNDDSQPGTAAWERRADGAVGGGAAQLVAKEGDYALVKLPSGETRKISHRLHGDHRAGRQYRPRERHHWQGGTHRVGWARSPHNRGVSMNPVDHPHGGGEGKTSGGRHPVTPWGQPTRGYKTRNNKRTDKFIVSRKK